MAELMRVRSVDLDRGEVFLTPESVLCQGCSGDRCAHGGTRTLRAAHDGTIALAPGDRVEVVAPPGAIGRAVARLVGLPALGVVLGAFLVGGALSAVVGGALGLALVAALGSGRGDLLRVERLIPSTLPGVIDRVGPADPDSRTDA